MAALIETIGWLNLGLFVVAAFLAGRRWRRSAGPGLWVALTFGSLAFVLVAGRLLPDQPETFVELLLQRLLIALLVLFPYLLYRFTTAFAPSSRRLARLLGSMTTVLLVWTFALPDIPQEGEPRSSGFQAYLVAFVVHWTVFAIAVAVRLWLAGSTQPSVARRRMRALAVGAVAITAALFLSAFGGDGESPRALATALLTTASALGFMVALDPPALLRLLWRHAEQERVQAAMTQLLGAVSERDVADRVLPVMARLVGAEGIALCGRDGGLIGAIGLDDDRIEAVRARGGQAAPEALRIESVSGELLVWLTPYAPFFGTEELRLLQTLGAMTELALERARLIGQERETLRRADELKTQFVALAAHELRTPVASVVGLAETVESRGELLPPEQEREVKRVLGHQARRLQLLVDQLLDLSRLDAEAITISPEPIPVGERVADIVAGSLGPRAGDVRVDIERGLEARLDPEVFDRILANLVANALSYGGPPVIVSAIHTDRHFRLAVEDRGVGVPSELVPQLFDRFSRGQRSEAGSGLGLAIARSFARAHGGDLLYAPAQPHGARFEFVVPTAVAGGEPAGG